MIEDIKHFRVNWIDGMKISKDHFNDLQNYAQEIVKDTTSVFLKKDNYGLVSSHLSLGHEYSVNIDIHKNINISIQRLRGIAPNGARIEINSKTLNVEQNLPFQDIVDEKIEEGYIMITQNPGQNTAFGEQNLEEVPPRSPYLNNSFLFSFVDAKNIVTSGVVPFQIPIAKIKKENDIWEVNDNYIAPCMTIAADPRLIDFYIYTDAFLKKMERSSVKIVQKIITEEHSNPIADIIQVICTQLLNFLGVNITQLVSEKHQNSPKKVIETIVSIARVMKNHIDTSSPENKEMLLIYFGEWTDLNGGDYENLFTKTINLEYQQYDINLSLEMVNKFMFTLDKLFTILTEVDYIGKKKDSGIFVNENIVRDNDNSPTFLTD